MDQTNDIDYQQEEDILLPGFRFHPTDEELVGFYLRRKVQQKPLCIELIKQLDIYKFDPWDLPKMSNMGEKEWYFYCTRDRKYPNSNRPNRVTGAGFWKATGIDKPIYSSITKGIIGLKKSLVFYKGRAAKGFKTEWMMHEFRLPASPNASNNVQAHNDSWTICRVFKKSTLAQRTLQHRRSLCIPSGNSIPVNSVREELPSNETGIQTSSSSNLCNSSLTNDQCCSCESYPPQMIGYSKINQNSGDHDMHLTEKSTSFQNQEMSQKYFNHDQMSHFSTNSMQVQVSPRIADVTDYRPPWLDHKIHQLNFSYDHHQQTTTSGSYTDPADADFLKNINNRLGQGSSSQDYIFGLNYLMS